MAWITKLTPKAEKQAVKLPKTVMAALLMLMQDIGTLGPVRGDWPNYGKLTGNRHHCHLKKGNPTYVAVWTVDKETIKVEVTYVGTHEKAPY
jgi:mRNA-degrading endonuclease RelE of RelBE toxin-antitoxin system